MIQKVIENIYDDLLELSSIEKQKEYWLGKSTSHISSFEEVMCRLFDDNRFDDFVDNIPKKMGFSKEDIFRLETLRYLLKNYKEKESDEEIINDFAWGKIVNLANEVIKNWPFNNDN